MNVYAVRLIDGHEVVGIFSVCQRRDLAYFVDHVVDPSVCEAARLPEGGIAWARSPAPIIPSPPMTEEDEGTEEFDFSQASFIEPWFILDGLDSNRLRWSPV